jgi:exodeoxyribonuclease VII large subunit
VARAIAGSGVPVVSAVGHETDFTIADFVADLRAPTPSAAAELVTQHVIQWPKRLESAESHLIRAMQLRLSRASDRLGRQGIARAQLLVRLRMNRLSQRLDDLESRLRRGDLRLKLQEAKERELRLAARLEHAMRLRLNRARPRVERMESSLRQLSPLAVLERGYAIVMAEGKAVREAPATGTDLEVRVAGGPFRAVTY